jgi:hypothetical protein
MLQAEREKPGVGFLPVKVLDDLSRAPTQERVAAEDVGTQPFADFGTAGNDFLVNGLIDGRIVVG